MASLQMIQHKRFVSYDTHLSLYFAGASLVLGMVGEILDDELRLRGGVFIKGEEISSKLKGA